MSGVHKFCEKDRGMGWDLLTVPEILNPAEGWLDEGGNLVLRATVTLPNGQVAMQEKAPVLSVSRAQIVGKDPTPLSPEWHEVRFDGRQEYDPGDEFKWQFIPVVSDPKMGSAALPHTFTY
ncbi:hypothetical protein FOZ60_006359 [Perkinsus olseni]|uniref:Uncharacterized protein n=1 Tax=Perkinsus olseni TaxID=32597 RepID=A0A7J6NNY0_PEROL|nr:hypothetical protein FOZ60_006359 [Perkinsus olseni]